MTSSRLARLMAIDKGEDTIKIDYLTRWLLRQGLIELQPTAAGCQVVRDVTPRQASKVEVQHDSR